MSFVATQPELLVTAAGNLAGVGSAVADRNASAASVAGVVPAAADQVSVLTAAQFAAYGHLYQAVSSQAEVIFDLFVSTLRSGAGAYGITEAANAFTTGG